MAWYALCRPIPVRWQCHHPPPWKMSIMQCQSKDILSLYWNYLHVWDSGFITPFKELCNVTSMSNTVDSVLIKRTKTCGLPACCLFMNAYREYKIVLPRRDRITCNNLRVYLEFLHLATGIDYKDLSCRPRPLRRWNPILFNPSSHWHQTLSQRLILVRVMLCVIHI